VLGVVLLDESLSTVSVAGMGLIVAGLVVLGRGGDPPVRAAGEATAVATRSAPT